MVHVDLCDPVFFLFVLFYETFRILKILYFSKKFIAITYWISTRLRAILTLLHRCHLIF